MIKSFKHKGLKEFFVSGNTRGIKQDHVKRLRRQLAVLNSLANIKDLQHFPGYYCHLLKGDYKDHYSIRVSGNYRLVFRWDDRDKDVYVLDYRDYH
jgi:proteic killer suppression protein